MTGHRNWMLELARHYARVRSACPADRLLVVFEIDGPIVDQRHVVPGMERPRPGVLEVIRWFQLQPSTFVGLNTSRPEQLRDDTLRALNTLGRDLRVDLRALVGENDLPDQVQLVWHGVNDEVNLREFLSSTIGWGECDVRRDPRQRLMLRHDSFERTPWTRDEPLLTLATALEEFARNVRGLKLDLKEGPGVLDEVLALLEGHGFDDDRLWFNASIDAVDAEGFRRLRSAHPGAIVQCPVDFLAPLVVAAPKQARAVLRMLAGWGISRFSVAWGRESTLSLVRQLEEWGFEVNLYAVPDHESFLQAVLLVPRSVTADFNFPDWNYYGRGSGEQRRYHRYPSRQSTAVARTGDLVRAG